MSNATSSPATNHPPISGQNSTRLYIAPFSPDLVAALLPRNLLEVAHDISYHALQTFPENTFGYISLPGPDATRLKSKFNGSILRGVKMRVEEARPDKAARRRTRQTNESLNNNEPVDSTEEKRSKKAQVQHAQIKTQNGLLPAIELPEGRHVTRGWSHTGARGEKKKTKNDGQAQNRMVFRSKAPSHPESPIKQSKHAQRGSKRNSRSGEAIEVTEFATTSTFPSFLRENNVSNDSERASQFVQGQGWVGEHGNIVEAVEMPRKRRRKDSVANDDDPRERELVTPDTAIPSKEDKSLTVTSEELPVPTSADNDSATTDSRTTNSITPTPVAPIPSQSSDLISSLEAKADVESKDVHPLEALFKRPAPRTKSNNSKSKSTTLAAPRPAPIKTSFSFFSSDDAQDERSSLPPQTPFTRQDMEMRGIRSAAPTPDTAAIGKRFRMPWRRGTTEGTEDSSDHKGSMEPDGLEKPNESHDSTMDDLSTQETTISASTLESSPSAVVDEKHTEPNEFEKKFWENRGEYNRAWKARKREARKQVRQSENRKRGMGRK